MKVVLQMQKELLNFYYLILKLHSRVLPQSIKIQGKPHAANAFLKSEFKQHYNSDPKYMSPFVKEW